MSDFSIHPVLRSPFVAAVVCGVVGIGMVDIGVAEILHAAGETQITPEDWSTLVNSRWLAAVISGALAWFAWFMLFRCGEVEIRVPLAGVALGVFGLLAGGGLVVSLYQSTTMPEFHDGLSAIWRLAALWSALVLVLIVGCVRLGLRSYRMMRGVS
jgi:hypothetical protein